MICFKNLLKLTSYLHQLSWQFAPLALAVSIIFLEIVVLGTTQMAILVVFLQASLVVSLLGIIDLIIPIIPAARSVKKRVTLLTAVGNVIFVWRHRHNLLKHSRLVALFLSL